MLFIKHLNIFIKNNFKQLGRKWLSLPLLLLFPIIIIALISTIIIVFFTQIGDEPIKLGIVDLDKSNETQVIVELISESSLLGDFIDIHSMSEPEAIERVENDQLSTYILFPEGFTSDLYQGEPVILPIIGNPEQPTESYLIRELIDSVTRHISASQANILTINYYAKELLIDNDTRNEMLFEQFTDFLFYTIGKDKVIDQKVLTNHATTSPIHYYGLASWFMITMIWLLVIYNFLYKDDTIRMKHRMKLYGVTQIQQLLARIIVTLIVTSAFAFGTLIALQNLLDFDLFRDDYLRIMFTFIIHSVIFLESLAIIETIIPSQKLRLLGQSLLTFILIVVSGTIIPTLYFPLQMQAIIPYVFSNLGFYWLQEVILNERLYVNYYPLLLISIIGLCVLIGCSHWKERVK